MVALTKNIFMEDEATSPSTKALEYWNLTCPCLSVSSINHLWANQGHETPGSCGSLLSSSWSQSYRLTWSITIPAYNTVSLQTCMVKQAAENVQTPLCYPQQCPRLIPSKSSSRNSSNAPTCLTSTCCTLLELYFVSSPCSYWIDVVYFHQGLLLLWSLSEDSLL